MNAAAPTLWNRLPGHICDIGLLGAFKRQVKTYLFGFAYR